MTMLKTHWRSIRDAIEADIKDGTLEPGTKLPTEPELAQLYRAGRHSIRRAIAELARDGQVSVEQGRGTFVQSQPMIDYAIGRRTRLRRNLVGQSVDIGGQGLGAERVPARGRPRKELGLKKSDMLIVSRRITHADGLPIAVGALYHDAARFPDFPERRNVLGSVSEVYRAYGIDDYLRGQTTLLARPARSDEADLLKQHPDLPVMVVRALDTLLDGTPISYSEVIWSAGRVKFTINPDETEI